MRRRAATRTPDPKLPTISSPVQEKNWKFETPTKKKTRDQLAIQIKVQFNERFKIQNEISWFFLIMVEIRPNTVSVGCANFCCCHCRCWCCCGVCCWCRCGCRCCRRLVFVYCSSTGSSSVMLIQNCATLARFGQTSWRVLAPELSKNSDEDWECFLMYSSKEWAITLYALIRYE